MRVLASPLTFRVSKATAWFSPATLYASLYAMSLRWFLIRPWVLALYRHDVFTGEHLNALERIFSDVCASFDCRLEDFNGETNHVHLLVSFPPTVELSRLVNSLKGVSSRYIRRDYPELARHYWKAQRLWSPSYYAGTAGGAPLATLKRYIENQNRPA